MGKNKKKVRRRRKRNNNTIISVCRWRLHMYVVLSLFPFSGGDADLQLWGQQRPKSRARVLVHITL